MVAYEREGARLAAAARGVRGRGRGTAWRALGAPPLSRSDTPTLSGHAVPGARHGARSRRAAVVASRYVPLTDQGEGAGEVANIVEAWSELDLR